MYKKARPIWKRFVPRLIHCITIHHTNRDLLPGSSDVQKQITYGDHAFLRHKEYGGRIKSAFVLPFCSDTQNNVRVVGYAESNWRDNSRNHQCVYLVLMDTEYIIDAFIAGSRCGKYTEEIVGIIEKYQLNDNNT